MKKLIFNEEARNKLLKGAKTVYDAVSSTLGPKANNVAIERDYGVPIVIHDGVNVSRECVGLEDKFENVGAELIKGAADKMDSVGDGTTLTTILTYEIAKEANRNIVAGANSMMLRKGINLAVEKIVENVDKLAIPVETDEQIKQIATISAQNDEIGELISGAIKKLGRDAIITVEESGTEMSVDYKEGMAFDKGFASHYFITNPESNEAELEDPYILVTDYRISDMKQFIGFFSSYNEGLKAGLIENTSLLIIANGVDGAPLATLVSNKLQGHMKPLVVNAPGFNDVRDILEDIAVSTGGSLVSKEKGLKLEDVKPEHLGRAKKVISSKDSTTIIGGNGDDKLIKERVKLLKTQIEKSTYEFETEKLQERLARLTSGIAVINVGADSEAEVREKKERCIDAIAATKAAIEGGIVSGGEISLIEATKFQTILSESDDVLNGAKIVINAIKKPFEKLMENSGYNSGQMLERILNSKKGFGIDVMDGEVKNMIEAGIIDPANVVKNALKYASSSAIMLMTTSTVIINVKEKDELQN